MSTILKEVYIQKNKQSLKKELWCRDTSNFSPQYHPWITRSSHENKGNDQQRKKLLISKQILLVSTLRKCIKNSVENIHTDVRV